MTRAAQVARAVLCFVLPGLPLAAVAGQTCSAPIPAGTCGVPASTSLTVPDVMQLTLPPGSTSLTPPAAADYDAGYVANTGPTATVKSNRAWRLQVSAGSTWWTASNTTPGVTARTNKPATDLLWSTAAAGGPFQLSLAPRTAASGGGTGGTPATFFLRTVYDWGLDTPGDYSLQVIFTLVAP